MKQVIEVKNLTYTYPDDKVALQNIDLDILEGEAVGIIGPNGAGKTTLLLHLNGILQGNGRISILGMELNRKNLKNIRSKIGFVFQDPDDQLFMPTVFDDVAFGPLQIGFSEDEIQKLVKESLASVELKGFEERLSHHLSFGEKRRVTLAIAFAMKPQVLILDEPTSNLDPATRREFIELIKNSNSPRTKIVASHDLNMIGKICQKVIVLNKGKKITEGNSSEILNDKELLIKNRLL